MVIFLIWRQFIIELHHAQQHKVIKKQNLTSKDDTHHKNNTFIIVLVKIRCSITLSKLSKELAISFATLMEMVQVMCVMSWMTSIEKKRISKGQGIFRITFLIVLTHRPGKNKVFLFIYSTYIFLSSIVNHIYMVIKEVIDDSQTHCRLPTPLQLLTGCPIEDLKCFLLCSIKLSSTNNAG